MNVQQYYQQAIKFAALKHVQQTIPGTQLSYVVHISNVAMEILIAAQHTAGFNAAFAVQLALLHDCLEDTETSFDELADMFGIAVAEGVSALTKNDSLPKTAKMADSLQRIQQQPKEVWAVKLADRITNLQPPPEHWNRAKIQAYREEAKTIQQALKGANAWLEKRLAEMIEGYAQWV